MKSLTPERILVAKEERAERKRPYTLDERQGEYELKRARLQQSDRFLAVTPSTSGAVRASVHRMITSANTLVNPKNEQKEGYVPLENLIKMRALGARSPISPAEEAVLITSQNWLAQNPTYTHACDIPNHADLDRDEFLERVQGPYLWVYDAQANEFRLYTTEKQTAIQESIVAATSVPKAPSPRMQRHGHSTVDRFGLRGGFEPV